MLFNLIDDSSKLISRNQLLGTYGAWKYRHCPIPDLRESCTVCSALAEAESENAFNRKKDYKVLPYLVELLLFCSKVK